MGLEIFLWVNSGLFEKLHLPLLTNNLTDRYRLSKCTRFTASTGVYGHYTNVQQVTGCQILDAVAVTWRQLLISNNPL